MHNDAMAYRATSIYDNLGPQRGVIIFVIHKLYVKHLLSFLILRESRYLHGSLAANSAGEGLGAYYLTLLSGTEDDIYVDSCKRLMHNGPTSPPLQSYS
jgi:hypothetical protein